MTRRRRCGSRPARRPIACCASARRTTSGRWAIPVRAAPARRSTTSAATTCRRTSPELVNGPGDDTMEIWNLVFMQYDRDGAASSRRCRRRRSTPAWAWSASPACCRKASTNYDIDLFKPIMKTDRRAQRPSLRRQDGRRARHRRARALRSRARVGVSSSATASFRRTKDAATCCAASSAARIRFGRKLPKAVVLSQLVDSVIEAMGDAYPEIRERRQAVLQTLAAEEERFSRTLTSGMERVGAVLDDVRARGERTLGGEEVFRLYDTFGIPVDLIGEMAEEEGVTLDREGFETMMSGARAKAKASSKFQSSTDAATFAKIAEKAGQTEFVGYDQYGERAVDGEGDRRRRQRARCAASRLGRRGRARPDAVLRRVGRADRRHRHAGVEGWPRHGARHAEAGRRAHRLARSRRRRFAHGSLEGEGVGSGARAARHDRESHRDASPAQGAERCSRSRRCSRPARSSRPIAFASITPTTSR